MNKDGSKGPQCEPPDCLQDTMHHRADSGLESKPAELKF